MHVLEDEVRLGARPAAVQASLHARVVEVAGDGRLPLVPLVQAGVCEQERVGGLEDDDGAGLGVPRPVGLGVGALGEGQVDLGDHQDLPAQGDHHLVAVGELRDLDLIKAAHRGAHLGWQGRGRRGQRAHP